MKKTVFVAAFAALAFAGCQKEASFDAPQTNEIVLTAVSDNFPDSKTVLDGVKVLWNGGDRIAVYNGNGVAEFSTAAADKSATADFTTSSEGFAAANSYLAVYPYSDGLVFEDGKVTVTVPESQTATAGSFDPKANVAVASGAADALQFKNVCSYLKFTVPAAMTDLTEVVLSANGSEKLAGSVKAVCADASFEVVDGVSSVVLEGVFEAGKSYYIAVLPGTLASGFTLTMTRSGKTSTMTTDKAFTFTRSRSANIGELYDGTWRVALEGSAVPEGAYPVLTQTLENENLFACLEDLKEGSLSLRVLYDNLYIATANGAFTDGEAVAYTAQNTPASITIPADGKYRIVLDKKTSQITIYSPDTNPKNKKVTYNNTVTGNKSYTQEVTALWMYGTFNGLNQDKGYQFQNKYQMTQSLANPYLFVWYNNGEELPRYSKVFQTWDNIEYTGAVNFFVSNIQNNVYAYGSTADAERNKKTGSVKCTLGEKAKAVAGQSDNRYAVFLIPEGANYCEVDIENLTVLFEKR